MKTNVIMENVFKFKKQKLFFVEITYTLVITVHLGRGN